MNTGPRDWDAETYDRVSDPQFEWGMEVLERLDLEGDERVLDAGCGSGRVTAELRKRLPGGEIVAVDGSESMLAKARENLGDDRITFMEQDLAELTLDEPVDVVFSTATFHWLPDHDNLFRRVAGVLRPGGRLHAQCGGAGNVAKLAKVISGVGSEAPFREHFENLPVLWNFAEADDTERRLTGAGFTDVKTWLEPKPLVPPQPTEFMRTVTLGPHLARLPEELRPRFTDEVVAAMGDPPELDYVRLNMSSVKRSETRGK